MRPAAGDLEAALERLWQSQRRRLWTPRGLWTQLGLRRRFRLTFLRPASLRVEVPAGLLPDCEACLELCCTGPHAVVSLRLRDVAALIDAGLEDHICRSQTLPVLGSGPGRRPTGDGDAFAKIFPVLRRDVTGTCGLLTPDRRCGAWPAWPLSCARYPYSLDVERRRVFLAGGCGSHRMVQLEDPPDAIRQLVDATARGYNERIKDIILLHLAAPDLRDLGLLTQLRLPPAVQRRLAAAPRAAT